jgi:hypothetical protein
MVGKTFEEFIRPSYRDHFDAVHTGQLPGCFVPRHLKNSRKCTRRTFKTLGLSDFSIEEILQNS